MSFVDFKHKLVAKPLDRDVLVGALELPIGPVLAKSSVLMKRLLI